MVPQVWSPSAFVLSVFLVAGAAAADAQVLLDRVLARVNGALVTLSDVRGGRSMGLVVAREDEMELALEQWVQRTLLLQEVERFPPPEPEAAVVDGDEARLRSRIGSSLEALRAQTGLDDRDIRQAARDTARIRAYLDQRFGATVQVSDEEVRAYYSAHPDEFTRNGGLVPFEQVEDSARELASAARRQTTIEQWLTDLRQRADVVLNEQ